MVNPKLKDELNDRLFEAMASLKDREECYQFFEDICTISEIKAMAQRLEVARMLEEEGIPMKILFRAQERAQRRSAG